MENERLGIHTSKGHSTIYFGNQERERELPDKDVVQTFIQMSNTRVTNESTQYTCKNFKLSDFGMLEPNDAVLFKPIIDNAQMLHHLILFSCAGNLNTSREPYDCYSNMPECDMIYIWAVGGRSFYTPKDVGFRIGGRTADNLVLQIHYDNQQHLEGHFDSSGAILYSTKHFRKMEAGVLSAGANLNAINIPPLTPSTIIQDSCVNSCGTSSVFFIAYAFHMHLIGKKIETSIFRNGVIIHTEREDDFSFDRQDLNILEKEVEFRRGDTVRTICDFNSSNRTTVTRGGFPTTSEMCYNFIIYYPKYSGPKWCIRNFCRLP